MDDGSYCFLELNPRLQVRITNDAFVNVSQSPPHRRNPQLIYRFIYPAGLCTDLWIWVVFLVQNDLGRISARVPLGKTSYHTLTDEYLPDGDSSTMSLFERGLRGDCETASYFFLIQGEFVEESPSGRYSSVKV